MPFGTDKFGATGEGYISPSFNGFPQFDLIFTDFRSWRVEQQDHYGFGIRVRGGAEVLDLIGKPVHTQKARVWLVSQAAVFMELERAITNRAAALAECVSLASTPDSPSRTNCRFSSFSE